MPNLYRLMLIIFVQLSGKKISQVLTRDLELSVRYWPCNKNWRITILNQIPIAQRSWRYEDTKSISQMIKQEKFPCIFKCRKCFLFTLLHRATCPGLEKQVKLDMRQVTCSMLISGQYSDSVWNMLPYYHTILGYFFQSELVSTHFAYWFVHGNSLGLFC